MPPLASGPTTPPLGGRRGPRRAPPVTTRTAGPTADETERKAARRGGEGDGCGARGGANARAKRPETGTGARRARTTRRRRARARDADTDTGRSGQGERRVASGRNTRGTTTSSRRRFAPCRRHPRAPTFVRDPRRWTNARAATTTPSATSAATSASSRWEQYFAAADPSSGRGRRRIAAAEPRGRAAARRVDRNRRPCPVRTRRKKISRKTSR